MVKYLYNLYGEDNLSRYAEQKMWLRTENNKTRVRAFPFILLAGQAVFSIRTLKLFLPDVKVEIRTNQPTFPLLKWLKKTYKNINIIDCKETYQKYKEISFWQYRIRYDALINTDDDTIMIDADTYFVDKPDFKISDDVCWISKGHNMGILGLTKKNCHEHIPPIIEQINEKADPEGKEARAIDEIITLKRMETHNIKLIETGKWIEHYFHPDKEYKYSIPDETLYEELKKKALGKIDPDTKKEYETQEGKKMFYPWVFKWKTLRQDSTKNILEMLHEFDNYAEKYEPK